MVTKQKARYLSYSRVLVLLILLSLGMQLIVLSQMYFFKFEFFQDPARLVLRLFRGTLLSFIAGALMVYPAISMIRYLNARLPWKQNVLKRFALQFIYAVAAGMVVTPVILIPARLVFTMDLDLQAIVNNTYYMVILSLFLMVILEALDYFDETNIAKVKAESLERELSQIRFEVLKSQINPHFMFNSLNVLSGLINKDVGKAQQFIDEFSQIYRYVLETIEQPVATLGKELDFTRSYIFLQQIRYGNSLSYSVNVPSELLRLVMPPLSLQVVLENAIKHNIINQSKPLHIDIGAEGHLLVIKNNIQPKISSGVSTGLGLKNLVKRYAIISKLAPVFVLETSHYIAKLPLIDTDTDERTDHRR